MRNRVKMAMMALVLLLSAGVVLAQHNHGSSSGQSAQQNSGEDMMSSCRKHVSESIAALDKLEKTIAAGRESNDPARMKAALNQAQTEAAEARHHVSMCPMMSEGNMHQDMHHDMKHMQQTKPEDNKSPQ